MNNYNFYVSKVTSVPLIGKFATDENTGETYAVLHSSSRLKRGKLLIAKERNEVGETDYVEHYYITNIEPIHNAQPLKKVKVHFETESEHAERKTQTRHFWIPIIITNLISLVGLIVAILAYIKE